jgi:FdhD protein
VKRKIKAFKSGNIFEEEIDLPEETAFSIYVNGSKLAVIACSNSNLNELGIGFLFNEGIINSLDDLSSFELDASHNFYAKIKGSFSEDFARARILTSGCAGGDISLASLKNVEAITGYERFKTEEIIDFINRSLASFEKEKRGIHHASAIFASGKIHSFSDLGRHNALDKLAGFMLLNKISPPTMVLATGRLSSEMVIKLLRMKTQIGISLSSPTTAAVTLAEKYRLTLIGYARKSSFKIYTHSGRLLF